MFGNHYFTIEQERIQVSEQFRNLQSQAVRDKIWSALIGRRPKGLLNLADVQQQFPVDSRAYLGIRWVPIAQIRGSEGRCNDFDAKFRPLRIHVQDRWVDLAIARNHAVALPAVELVQIEDSYFVRDGHHRISVAKQFGQLEIEAEVTVWHSKYPLPTYFSPQCN
jgi:hypothetical protein